LIRTNPVTYDEDGVSRFWKYAKPTPGCWEWAGVKNRAGYGALYLHNGLKVLAHRLSYAIHNGSLPSGCVVRHKCDNPECTNPDHLEAGTQADNVRDMHERGGFRSNKGKSYASKLQVSQRSEVRDRFLNGESCQDIARQYNVSIKTIYRYANRTGRYK
jgi:hypothetical protein